ncbi:hypothetical protein EDB89DRAFT_2229270 [Lactarius sanguifluus]|nr:hypothetical protein EDB89DRAFT_2229270 [Lactarius sanguifluus]
MPIVVQYGGSLELGPPAPKDEDNIMAALKQPDRVSSISLTLTSSLLRKLSSIKRPFSELEDLVLVSRDGVRLAFPNAFQRAPRLRYLHSTRVAIPRLRQFLYSSTNLVDLQLHEVFDYLQFSPEALTNALSGMAQLQSLSLHFLSTINYPTLISRSSGHAVLPVLTRLSFRGVSGYLERLVAGTSAPHLGDIELTFLNQIIIGLPKLCEFIDRIEMHKSHRRAHILSSERAISLSLIQPGVPTCLKLKLLLGPLGDQLSSMAQICIHSPALVSNVEDLHISVTRPSSGQDDSDREQWLMNLIQQFKCAKWLYVAGDLSTNIVFYLPLSDLGRATLPALNSPRITESVLHYVPSLDAAASVTDSHRLSGHTMEVKYERPWINELRGTDPFSHQVTFEMLPDDVLLNIFRHHLNASAQFWPKLTHICRRWRQIIFTSPLVLGLRLHCTYGTPVLATLDLWPALPIIVQYGGSPTLDPPTLKDEENIVAALRHSDRVTSIGLTISSSLLERLFAIGMPYLELEELVLLSRDTVELTLPSTFRWGTRLRTLHLTGIAIPALPQFLSPSTGLVDIQLHDLPMSGYFSPEAFANALSEATQLETLSLHFLSLPPRRNYLSLPLSSGERIVLPVLTCLKYRGTSKYLDSLVARIDAPRLRDIDITFFSQPTMDASQLGRFVERIGMQTSLSQAAVQTSAHAISISFFNPLTSTSLELQISCPQLDWQLSSMAQICDHFSPFLSRVNNLAVKTIQPSSGHDDVDGEQWLDLIRAFGGATDLRVAGVHVADILCALRPADGGNTNVLPALCSLLVDGPIEMHGPSWDAVQSLITSQRLSGSGRPIEVYARKYSCHMCSSSSTEQRELKTHLGFRHAYRTVCSYCSDFECTLGDGDIFREHLASKHPEVARNDALISNPVLTRFRPSQLDDLIDRHSSLLAPDIIASSNAVTAPYSQ